MDMIRRLHRRFILIATAAIFFIVAAALGVINGVLYVAVREEVSSMLTHISENGGSLGEESAGGTLRADGSWTPDTPELSYQTRFFSVLLDADGTTAKIVNVNHIAAFTSKEALETAVAAARSGNESGFFKKDKADYAYRVTETASGDVLIVILDCTRDLSAVRAFLRYSSMFGLLCILLFVVIVTVLSKRAIRPFIENAENQRRFITNAGHELKTPIAIISANAEALELIGGENEWTGNIIKQVRRLTTLINDLITLAKVGEASERAVELTDVDLSECARGAADSFRQLVTDSGKTFETDVADGIVEKADAHFFTEAANILLDNAAKYCDDGGTIRLVLSRGKRGKGAVLAVANEYKDGAGVDYERFFERFYRGDTSHNSGKAGYGIGLSMAADMVRLMKGRMDVKWEKGIITFSVHIGTK